MDISESGHGVKHKQSFWKKGIVTKHGQQRTLTDMHLLAQNEVDIPFVREVENKMYLFC